MMNEAISLAVEKTIEEELSLHILLADRVFKVVTDVDSFKLECSEISLLVQAISSKLLSAIQFAASKTSPPPYDRSIHRIFTKCTKNLERALLIIRHCKRMSGLMRQVLTIATRSANFCKVGAVLDTSIQNLVWLLSVYESSVGDIMLSLPPITSTDPILSWVWSYIAKVQKGMVSVFV